MSKNLNFSIKLRAIALGCQHITKYKEIVENMINIRQNVRLPVTVYYFLRALLEDSSGFEFIFQVTNSERRETDPRFNFLLNYAFSIIGLRDSIFCEFMVFDRSEEMPPLDSFSEIIKYLKRWRNSYF
jgi:hypothetical protein